MFMKNYPANMTREGYAKNYGKQVAEQYQHYGDPKPPEAMGQEICRLQYDLQEAMKKQVELMENHKKLVKYLNWNSLIVALLCVAFGFAIGGAIGCKLKERKQEQTELKIEQDHGIQ